MIYLLSQILLSLALAALFGGALGWLAHRARTDALLDTVREELAQRTRLLAEARGDVQMLEDDFEELRARSRAEIDDLRAQNRELPTLATNLEKSQLMVRQLMQRHDAQSRELNARNEELAEQLVMMRAQADLRERAHAELESARLREGGGEVDGAGAAREPDSPLAADVAASGADMSARANLADAPTSPPPRSWASRRLGKADAGEGADGADETGGGEALDEVMEVDADLAASLRDDDEPSGAPRSLEGIAIGPAELAPLSVAAEAGTVAEPEGGDARADGTSEDGAWSETIDDERDDTVDGDDEANATLAIDILPADLELAFDLDDRDAPLFDPVDRQDDLQRLFGIGPITEKALNTLGITSYSQLAELERHEIEKIANALQIVPERIEKDDWVGNARRQLEDVLEQL